MGWVVIDTNQAIRMTALTTSHKGAVIEGIIISPFVLGELLNSTDRRPIEKLVKYPLRLGMTPGEMMYRLASLRRSEIVAFRPFHNLTPQKVQQGLLNLPNQKVQEFVAEATTHIKASGDILKSARQAVRDSLKSQGYDPRKFKFDGFADALQKLATDPDNVLEVWLMQFVSDCGKRSVKTSPRVLYTGAMENPYLRRYFHTFLWYTLSFLQAWVKQYDCWNITLKEKKNDWTDMTLSLYAAPGDLILTEDGTLRKAVSAVNPDGAVRTALATHL